MSLSTFLTATSHSTQLFEGLTSVVVHVEQMTWPHLLKMFKTIELDSVFLQLGHTLWVWFESLVAEGDDENLTLMRDFEVIGWPCWLMLHLVVKAFFRSAIETFPSFWEGVREGSQKEGNFAFLAAFCSASIVRKAASSACWVSSRARAGRSESEIELEVERVEA